MIALHPPALRAPRAFSIDELDRIRAAGALDRPAALDGEQIVEADGRPYRFSVDEYYRVHETGVLDEDRRVELIFGEILDAMSIGNPHIGSVIRLTNFLADLSRGAALASSQNPIKLSTSVPQPDFTLLRPRADFYGSGAARPADCLLVVEVADSSLQHDLTDKAYMYGSDGVAEYWVVDVIGGEVIVHRDPTPTGYATVTTHGRGETLTLLLLPAASVAVDDILP